MWEVQYIYINVWLIIDYIACSIPFVDGIDFDWKVSSIVQVQTIYLTTRFSIKRVFNHVVVVCLSLPRFGQNSDQDFIGQVGMSCLHTGQALTTLSACAKRVIFTIFTTTIMIKITTTIIVKTILFIIKIIAFAKQVGWKMWPHLRQWTTITQTVIYNCLAWYLSI